MRILSMDNTKSFMSHLLIKNTFHLFLLEEAKIVTFRAVTIDGHIQKAFYSKDEWEDRKAREERTDFITWESAKPFCFDLIKGKKLPLRFQITLLLPKEKIPDFLEKREVSMQPEVINGLYFNIKFEDNALTLSTATSLSVFTLDPALEDAWAAEVTELLKKAEA